MTIYRQVVAFCDL